MKIALLVSGNLGMTLLQKLHLERTISLVFTDSHSSSIIAYCATNGIPLFKGNPRTKDFREFISSFEVDVLLSINYLFIIPADLIHFPKKFAINIHGSLLPKYRGRTPHVWAIINGETKTGITAHLIDEDCDTGDIIEQISIPIERNDTGNDVLEKYAQNYPQLIDTVLNQIENDTVNPKKQNNNEASYFGKRTPEDGRIDWNWEKERIYNWVRAQAKPYPGAFSFINNHKIIVHRLEFCEESYNPELENGKILAFESEKLMVKTRDGIVLLSELENLNQAEIKAGIILT